MCLIVFAWRPGHALPLIVAANRDEFHARPSLPLAHWDDAPQVVAGRDLQAGGTWLGVTTDGRFAALTNIRAPGSPVGERSRGELPERFLRGAHAPASYLDQLSHSLDQFSGFNLLVGNLTELWFLNSDEGTPRPLSPGVYGLSNAALDTPWPKLLSTRAALQACIGAPERDQLLEIMSNSQPAADAELPATGISYEMEKLLSSAFIASSSYGTRAITLLMRRADGSTTMTERRFGPNGVIGETEINLPSTATNPKGPS
ncbi:NRDE family protein [Stutzerimonas xanthomarina]|uniref:NRDE family protein n=1 Tax=Stutzerimonas xanthomarina TaxID=271420 RepID=UPI003AA89269